MKAFPEEFELVSFFESEPTSMDSDEIWVHKLWITFEVEYSSEKLYCSFSPVHGDIDLTLIENDSKKVELHLSYIENIEIIQEKDGEFLKAEFDEKFPFRNFLLKIKPTVSIHWGTELNKDF